MMTFKISSWRSRSRPHARGIASPRTLSPSRPRAHIEVDVAHGREPLDRSFNLSVGADYPGTMIRPESLAQLRTRVDEHGFRYIRFHAIFHDALGTVQVVDGKTVYDWTKIDQLYDALARHGDQAVRRARLHARGDEDVGGQTIFYWKGNTSHPQARNVARAGRRLRRAI